MPYTSATRNSFSRPIQHPEYRLLRRYSQRLGFPERALGATLDHFVFVLESYHRRPSNQRGALHGPLLCPLAKRRVRRRDPYGVAFGTLAGAESLAQPACIWQQADTCNILATEHERFRKEDSSQMV